MHTYVGGNPLYWYDTTGLFRWHGNWGGPGWAAGRELSEKDLTEADREVDVFDARDSCYRDHDFCIADNTCGNKGVQNCDVALAKCLANMTPLTEGFWGTTEGYQLNAWLESLLFASIIKDIYHGDKPGERLKILLSE